MKYKVRHEFRNVLMLSYMKLRQELSKDLNEVEVTSQILGFK